MEKGTVLDRIAENFRNDFPGDINMHRWSAYKRGALSILNIKKITTTNDDLQKAHEIRNEQQELSKKIISESVIGKVESGEVWSQMIDLRFIASRKYNEMIYQKIKSLEQEFIDL